MANNYTGDEYNTEAGFTPNETNSRIKNAPSSVTGENYNPKQRIQYSDASYTVHSVRPVTPKDGEISTAIKARHDQSTQDFPGLNLSAAEYVILFLKRHIIGIVFQVAIAIFLIALLFTALAFLPEIATSIDPSGRLSLDYTSIVSIVVGFCALIALGAYITTWVYRRNVLFLTNESIIQERQISLFAKDEQTISLGSIEDARYEQTGIIQMIFNYGTIRLTVEGHGTSYVFNFTPNPKRQTDIISNAIEAFKNGRPVQG